MKDKYTMPPGDMEASDAVQKVIRSLGNSSEYTKLLGNIAVGREELNATIAALNGTAFGANTLGEDIRLRVLEAHDKAISGPAARIGMAAEQAARGMLGTVSMPDEIDWARLKPPDLRLPAFPVELDDSYVRDLKRRNTALQAKNEALVSENEGLVTKNKRLETKRKALAAENRELKAAAEAEAAKVQALRRKVREMKMRDAIGDTEELTDPDIPPPDSISPDW